MRDLHNEFLYRKIKKPSKIFAWPVCFAFRIISKKNNAEFFYSEDFLKIKDEQMVYLCQHRSRNDYIYAFAGLKRTDIHILCGYQNVFQRGVYTLLKKLGVIAKMLYQPDVHATKQVLRAVKLGGSIMIFPEGIQSTSGSTHPINPATMKLLAKLKLPVALVTLKGSYFTRTRYSSDVKKGKITVEYSKLFDKEDFNNLSKDELYNKMLNSFQYNEFDDHKENKVAFYGKKPNIHGLDNIIYKCPNCLNEFGFSILGDSMYCRKCGFTVSMDQYYDIKAVKENLPFENIDEWYKWQRSLISKEVREDGFVLSAKVKIGNINTRKLKGNFSLEYHGEGTLTLTNKGLTYCGTDKGENVELFFNPKQVYSLSMSLQYDVDLYYCGVYYNFKFLENEKQVVKWMLAAEEIHNLYDKAWREVSDEVYGKK